MRALQILLENLQRFVDDDDAEVESQICHVKLMNDSLCRILVGGEGLCRQHVALTVSGRLVLVASLVQCRAFTEAAAA